MVTTVRVLVFPDDVFDQRSDGALRGDFKNSFPFGLFRLLCLRQNCLFRNAMSDLVFGPLFVFSSISFAHLSVEHNNDFHQVVNLSRRGWSRDRLAFRIFLIVARRIRLGCGGRGVMQTS